VADLHVWPFESFCQPHPTLGNSGGHSVFAIKDIRVSASSARAVVQDCTEAEDNTDARDKFFMVAVPEFDPRAASAAKDNAALLGRAEAHLGNLLAELYAAMPSLAACGFKASMLKQHASTSMLTRTNAIFMSRVALGNDATSNALGAVAPALGLDMGALQTLVTSTRETLAQISR